MIGDEAEAMMPVLLEAARRAGERLIGGSVLRGAATHTGADLLRELDKLGWTLAPKFAVAVYTVERELGTGKVYPFLDGPFRPMYPDP